MDAWRRLDHGGWYTEHDDPRWWQLSLGALTGLVLVTWFEWHQQGGVSREARFASLTGKESPSAVDPAVRRRLAVWINGAANVFDFWTGGFLVRADNVAPEQYVKVFETLGLLCALLLTCGVTYFTADTGQHFHLHGVVCCVANCSLLLGTLMSAFFAVTFGTFKSCEQAQLCVGLLGRIILRGPILFFLVGLCLLYAEMILWFKMTIDAGTTCVWCLTLCLILFPIFAHSMHKIGWALQIVNEQTDVEQRLGQLRTPEQLRARLEAYVVSKGGVCLLLDREEFLESLGTAALRATSVQRRLAGQLFDAHVDEALGQLGELGSRAAAISTPRTPREAGMESIGCLEGRIDGSKIIPEVPLTASHSL